jgi:hypothetical protein
MYMAETITEQLHMSHSSTRYRLNYGTHLAKHDVISRPGLHRSQLLLRYMNVIPTKP